MTSSSLSGFSRDPAEIENRIDQWAQGFAAKAERYRAAQEKTEQVRLTATSRDGSVQVTVRADGSVADLVFTEKIRSLPLPELSAQILATMRSAQGDIAKRVGEVMTEELGDEDVQTRTAMLDNLRQRFPEPPEEHQEQVPDKWDYGDEEATAKPRPVAPPASPTAAQSPTTQPPTTRPPTTRPAAPERPRSRPYDDDVDEDFDPLRD